MADEPLPTKGLPRDWENDLEQERIRKEMDEDLKNQREIERMEREQAAEDAREAREAERVRRREEEQARKTEQRERQREQAEQKRYGKDEKKRTARMEKEERARELVDDRKARERERQHEKIIRDEEKQIKREEFAKTRTGKIVKTIGNVILATKKVIETDGHGRSGKRATLAYRRANRSYNSEARKMRSQTASVGSFSAMTMFGKDKTPVRSRHRGMNQFAGTADPLSTWTSGMLGRPVHDNTIEGMGPRMVRTDYPDKTDKKKDRLKDFSRSLLGF